jgi:hypothetical protein
MPHSPQGQTAAELWTQLNYRVTITRLKVMPDLSDDQSQTPSLRLVRLRLALAARPAVNGPPRHPSPIVAALPPLGLAPGRDAGRGQLKPKGLLCNLNTNLQSGAVHTVYGLLGRALIGWPVQDWLRLGVVKGVVD